MGHMSTTDFTGLPSSVEMCNKQDNTVKWNVVYGSNMLENTFSSEGESQWKINKMTKCTDGEARCKGITSSNRSRSLNVPVAGEEVVEHTQGGL